MKISMRDFETIYDKIVNQIIFINALGEYEYHPEREDFLLDYFYLKYFENYKFKNEHEFETDLFSLAFYQDLADEMNKAMTEKRYENKTNSVDFLKLKKYVNSKVEFIKNTYFKKNAYGITDVYLGSLVSKITDWLEDKGIEQFLEVVSKTGEELGNQKLQRTKSETE